MGNVLSAHPEFDVPIWLQERVKSDNEARAREVAARPVHDNKKRRIRQPAAD